MFNQSSATRPSPLISHFALTVVVVMMTVLAGGELYAQESITGTTPSGLTPGKPSGSYSLSGFDNINLYNGGLNFHLPIVSVGGRGGAAASVGLTIEQKWIVRTDYSGGGGTPANYADYNWWGNISHAFYVGAKIEGRRSGDPTWPCESGVNAGRPVYIKSLTRLTVSTPDGTEYELRDVLTGGEPQTVPRNFFKCPTASPTRGRIFVTSDGSAATFVSDGDIEDAVWADEDNGRSRRGVWGGGWAGPVGFSDASRRYSLPIRRGPGDLDPRP